MGAESTTTIPPRPVPGADETARLQYGPRTPWRRRHGRTLVALAALVVACAAAWWWRGPIWDKARFLYWQHQCLAHAAAADQVAYEDGPPATFAAAAAAGATNDLVLPPFPSPSVLVEGACRVRRPPGYLVDLLSAMGEWNPAAHATDTTLFLGRLVSPSGTERLVWVSRRRHGYAQHRFDDRISVVTVTQATPFAPAGYRYDSAKFDGVGRRPLDPVAGYADHVRLYEGRPDPADRSHFTIDYELDGVRGTIDGWLRDDGTLTLLHRDGPAQRDRLLARRPPGRH